MAVVARRGRVLRSAGSDGVRKRDLVDDLDVSRSTIDRGIRELEGIGLIERVDGTYRRTLPGRLALEEYDAFRSRMGGLVESSEALSELPSDVEFDAAVLDDAEIVHAQRHSPHVPVSRLGDIVSRATHVRAIAPAVMPQQVETYRESIVERELTADVVLADAVVGRLVSAHRDALEETLATGRLSLRRADETIPYSLLVADTPDGSEVGVLVYGDGGGRVFIGNGAPAAVGWAHELIDEHWERAAPLRSPSDD